MIVFNLNICGFISFSSVVFISWTHFYLVYYSFSFSHFS